MKDNESKLSEVFPHITNFTDEMYYENLKLIEETLLDFEY